MIFTPRLHRPLAPGHAGALRRFSALIGILCLASAAQAALISPGRVAVPGCVPLQAVASAIDLGLLPPGETVHLTFVLPWRDPSGLNDLLQRLYDPADPLYGRYLDPPSFADRFGPDPADVRAVADYARGQGLTVASVSPNRLLIGVSGSASEFESALGVSIDRYQAPNGDAFLAPTSDPLLPLSIASRLLGIAGFGDHRMRSQATPTPAYGTGSGPNGTLSPSDIRRAYQLAGVTADGAGQTLGLLELDGYRSANISSYERFFNLPAVSLQNVLIDGFSGAIQDPAGADEAALDIEMMAALAPGATKILVYELQNGGNAVDLLNRMATDDLARAISSSWEQPEDTLADADLRSENAAFQEMAAQGQSFFAAAGDNGAYDDGSALSVGDPASQPYVCGVGGTSLLLNGDGSYNRETTWNTLRTSNPGAGGGGISGFWSLPAWQKGAVSVASRGSSTMRNVPDVSLNADTPYAIFASGAWQSVGGTSASAPLWAAFTALVNQQRGVKGLAPIGFINPALYQIGTGARYAADFHDIADGSNNGYFPATRGFDDASGWGSFNGQQLLADLSGSPTQTFTWSTLQPTQGPVGTTVTCTIQLSLAVAKTDIQSVSLVFAVGSGLRTVPADPVQFQLSPDPATTLVVTGRVPQGATTGPINLMVQINGNTVSLQSPQSFQVTAGLSADAFTIGALHGLPGQVVRVDIQASSFVMNLSGIQFELDYPAPAGAPVLQFQSAAAGSLFKNAFLDTNDLGTGVTLAVIASTGANGPGPVAQVNLTLPPTVSPGVQYPLQLKGLITDPNGNSVSGLFTPGVLIVDSPVHRGDLNGDGKITVADATLALQVAVGLVPSTPARLLAGDLNGNGKIDITDVERILQAIVGQTSP